MQRGSLQKANWWHMSKLGLPQFQVLSHISGSRSFLGGYPSPRFFLWSQVLSCEVPNSWPAGTLVAVGGYSSRGQGHSSALAMGIAQSQPGGYPSHGWGLPRGRGTSTARTGVTHWTELGYPLCQDLGTPHKTEQQSKYLLCSWWYASCSHTGGFSCVYMFIFHGHDQEFSMGRDNTNIWFC